MLFRSLQTEGTANTVNFRRKEQIQIMGLWGQEGRDSETRRRERRRSARIIGGEDGGGQGTLL